MSDLTSFISEHRVTEIECMAPDMAGIARGKIVPAEKFLRILHQRGLPMPEAVFVLTVTGHYPNDDWITRPINGDVFLKPDESTIRLVPWYDEPTALVICDPHYADGRPLGFASRSVLKRVLALYDEMGLEPVVAPELEFYLVRINEDPDHPLEAPVGRSGRKDTGRAAYAIDAVNEFDPIFDAMYDFCDAQNIDVDTLMHEDGAAQMEINFNHGNALELADQCFLFKRTAREAALRSNVYATFMAKPMEKEPGSAMHIHQSLVDARTGENVFSTKSGKDSKKLLHYIGGLQRYMPAAMPLIAPNVNSYRRLAYGEDAPSNLHWGYDNRTAGLRVPIAGPNSRRVENRVPGADANPYLAIAATLACGYLGLKEKIEPNTDPIEASAYDRAHTLPRHQFDALRRMIACRPLREALGEDFIDAYRIVKEAEFETYNRVISSWERDNLLLNV